MRNVIRADRRTKRGPLISLEEMEPFIRGHKLFEASGLQGFTWTAAGPYPASYCVAITDMDVPVLVHSEGKWFTMSDAAARKAFRVSENSVTRAYVLWQAVRRCVPEAQELSDEKILSDLLFYGVAGAVKRMVGASE